MNKHVPRRTDDWLPVVYECLHQLAELALRDERRGHTLQPTALVHEAYVRLRTGPRVQWNDRVHFLAVASRVVREVLVDHARRKRAAKRGGGWKRVTLAAADGDAAARELDLLDLEDALQRLGHSHGRAARVVELRFFGGLTIPEIAAELGTSPRTVDNDWHFARAWLLEALDGRDR